MRMSFEVISGEIDSREFPNRKTGEIEAVELLLLHGVDTDYPQSMYKVQIWRDFEQMIENAIKGAIIELKFGAIKQPDGRFEKLHSISCKQENIRVLKTAQEAIKEMQQQLAGKMREIKKASNGKPEPEAVSA